MIQAKDDKLIIEIDAPCLATEFLHDMVSELTDLIRYYDYSTLAPREGCPFFCTLHLINAMSLSYGQIKKGLADDSNTVTK